MGFQSSILISAFALNGILALCFGYIACYMLVSVVAYLSPWLPVWMWVADIGLLNHAVIMAACSTVGIISVIAQKNRGLRLCSHLLTILLLIEVACTVQVMTRSPSLFGAILTDVNSTMTLSAASFQRRQNDTLMWNEVQMEMNCCGIDSYRDWFATPFSQGRDVPDSCCLMVSPGCGKDAYELPYPDDTIITTGCLNTLYAQLMNDFSYYGGYIWLPCVACHIVLMLFIACFRPRSEKQSFKMADDITGSRYLLLSDPSV